MNEKKQNPISKLLTMKLGKIPILAIVAVIVAIIVIIVFATASAENRKKNELQVSTVSTLQKIVNVSELSTFQSVYNGVAVAHNEESPEEIDFYVSYEATVKAGMDFSKINIDIVDDSIVVTVPDIYITDTTVRVETLDYIFINDKSNTAGVTERALKECRNDLNNECENNETIINLAQENAVNVITALLKPVVEQLEQGYKFVIK